MTAKFELILNLILLIIELGLAEIILSRELTDLYTGMLCAILITMGILTINVTTYLKQNIKFK